jgi:hypothetical protein
MAKAPKTPMAAAPNTMKSVVPSTPMAKPNYNRLSNLGAFAHPSKKKKK